MKRFFCLLLSPLAVSLSWALGTQSTAPAPVATAPSLQPRVSVLSYGSIGQGEGALTPDAFEREMLYLKEAGFKVLTPAEYLEWRRGRKSLQENAVLLTFREQDASFAVHALPVLQRCGFSYMLMTAEAAATDAACSMVVDDVSFARAVNFGPAVAENAVLADVEACAPAKEAVPEGVTLPEFSQRRGGGGCSRRGGRPGRPLACNTASGTDACCFFCDGGGAHPCRARICRARRSGSRADKDTRG